MRTAGVDAPVAAVLQEDLGEGEDGYDELAVSILPIAQLYQTLPTVRLLLGVLNRCAFVQEQVARKVSRLEAFVQLVGGAEGLENAVEPVQDGNPMIEVATREGPSCRELVELCGDER